MHTKTPPAHTSIIANMPLLLRRWRPMASTITAPRTRGRVGHGPRAAMSTIIFKSLHPDIAIPEDQTIWDIIEGNVPRIGERPALICGLSNDTLSYRDLHASARRIAAALAADGVQAGDVVLVHAFNCMEYPLIIFALTSLGAVCSSVSPLFNAEELALQAKIAKAKFIITHRHVEDIALDAAEIIGIDTKNMYTVGRSDNPKRLKCISEASKREFDDYFPSRRVDPGQNVLLPFSSGTTGLPKGVALSARNILANTLQVSSVERFNGPILSMLPFFHIYATLLAHMAVYQGVPNVILPRFEPETFLTALEKYQIEKAHVAPPTVLFLAHDSRVDEYDLSATKYLISGGAPLGEEVERLVQQRLGVQMKQIYGMTELSPSVNYSEDSHRKPGSVGRLIPNTELRIKCTKTDLDLPRNEPGELLFRGPQVMMGYFNNDEATRQTIMADGFLRTGDIGYIDEDGFVRIIDRVKELIKYKGHQVAPAELEDILNHHPAIADSCAVRGFDGDGAEIPKAYVVLKDPSDPLTTEEVMAFVAERVAPYKKVREVEFIDVIPKSMSGKILRRQLQDRENQRLHQVQHQQQSAAA